jgi:hypothetical protein
MPRKIYGGIPNVNSTKLYEIQVGAFKNIKNGEKYILILQRNGYIPVYEQYLDFTRVKITGIPAKEVRSHLIKMKQMGFDEVIIREDSTRHIIIDVPEPEPEPEPEIEPEPEPEEEIEEIIEEIIYEEEEPEITLEPKKIDIDIFCRTWKIVSSDKDEHNGYIMIFSDDGTYLITNANGDAYTANWRWHGDEYDEFEYSHNNWRSYGRAKINKLDQGSLSFNDPGYNILGSGFSTIGKETVYDLVPIYNPDAPE